MPGAAEPGLLRIWDGSWGRTPGGRRCGGCTLCCKLLPIKEIGKGAGERCRHQRTGKGCAVYHTALPRSCFYWTCRWLANLDTADLSRPDRSHYVIDTVPTLIHIRENATGEKTPVEAVQVWVDPDCPEAHRDPALRRFIERQRKPALIRYSSTEAFALFPPCTTTDGTWLEQHGECSGTEQSVAEVLRELAEAGH